MKFRKKLIAFALAIVMCVVSIPNSIYADTETGSATETTTETTVETEASAEVVTESSATEEDNSASSGTEDTSGTSTSSDTGTSASSDTGDTSGTTTSDGTSTVSSSDTDSDSGTSGSSTNSTDSDTDGTSNSSTTEETEEASSGLLGATLAAEQGSTDTLQSQINAAESGAIITLDQDYTEDIQIADGKNVTIDLAGKTITAAGTSTSAISVYGTLTLTDSSEGTDEDGTITYKGAVVNADDNTARGVTVYSSGSFTFEGGTISGFSASGNGGGILVEKNGTFKMTGGIVSGNSATVYGGGIYIYEADQIADITGGTISGNTAGKSGGGLAATLSTSGSITFQSGLTISENTATSGYGGGVYYYSSLDSLTISSTISDNTSGSYGGGVYFGMSVDKLNITDATIDGNTAGDAGGGCYFAVAVPSATISGSSISNNNAAGNGGGLWFTSGTSLTLEDGSKINDNEISTSSYLIGTTTFYGRGAGIFLDSGTNASTTGLSASYPRSTFISTGGEISGNILTSTDSTDTYGGGIYIGGYATVNMSNTTISDNKGATYGGGIAIFTYAQEATFTNLTVSGNVASASAASGSGYGGGVYIAGNSVCTITVSGGNYKKNEAAYYGGGIYVTTATSSLVLQDAAVIDGNTSYNGGGGIYTEGYLKLAGGNSEDTAIQICYNEVTSGVGGGVYSSTSNSTAITATDYVDVYENSAGTNGGGLCVNAGGMDLSGHITIHNNYSKGTNYGGAGLYAGSNTTGTI